MTLHRMVSLVDGSALFTAFEARAEELASELSWEMGRAIAYAPEEIRRESLGEVPTVAAWNSPLLIATTIVLPADHETTEQVWRTRRRLVRLRVQIP